MGKRQLGSGATLHEGRSWYTADFGVEIVAVENHEPVRDWAAYIVGVQATTLIVDDTTDLPLVTLPLPPQEEIQRKAAAMGAKLDEDLARQVFPQLADVPYRD